MLVFRETRGIFPPFFFKLDILCRAVSAVLRGREAELDAGPQRYASSDIWPRSGKGKLELNAHQPGRERIRTGKMEADRLLGF